MSPASFTPVFNLSVTCSAFNAIFAASSLDTTLPWLVLKLETDVRASTLNPAFSASSAACICVCPSKTSPVCVVTIEDIIVSSSAISSSSPFNSSASNSVRLFSPIQIGAEIVPCF